MWGFIPFGEESVGQGQRFEFARGGDGVGWDQVKIDGSDTPEADILKGKDDVAAVGAEGGVAVTAIAFVRRGGVGFVRIRAVEDQIAEAVVADVAVEEEEQVAVPVEVDDLIRKLEAPGGKFVGNGICHGFAVLNIHDADGIDMYLIDVGDVFDGKARPVI